MKIDPNFLSRDIPQLEPRHRPQIFRPQEYLRALSQIATEQKFENSRLSRADFSKATSEVKQAVADTGLKVMAGVPGFSPPKFSNPPTQTQLRGLLQQIVTAEKQGLLKPQNYAQAKPENARTFFNKDSSPIGKAWGAFVQETTDAQNAQNKTFDGSPQEIFGGELQGSLTGASFKSAQFIGDPFAAMNNKQKLVIMSDAFGAQMAQQLKAAGVRDPLSLLGAAVTPEDRAQLAESLGISRGELLVHLARAELLLIPPGKGGAQALRPQHLSALSQSGIITLAQLSAAKNLDPAQMEVLYATIRSNYSGFARAMSGERPILKKDLQHWAKSAARRKSSILDSDWDEQHRKGGDAQEQIMAWYLENQKELEKKHPHQKEPVQLDMPRMALDEARGDGLICYWIERPNFDAGRPTFTETCYVCLDPKTGLVDQKQKE